MLGRSIGRRRRAEPMPLLKLKIDRIRRHSTPPVEMNISRGRSVGIPRAGCNFDVCVYFIGVIPDELMIHRHEERARPLRRREKIYRFVIIIESVTRETCELTQAEDKLAVASGY